MHSIVLRHRKKNKEIPQHAFLCLSVRLSHSLSLTLSLSLARFCLYLFLYLSHSLALFSSPSLATSVTLSLSFPLSFPLPRIVSLPLSLSHQRVHSRLILSLSYTLSVQPIKIANAASQIATRMRTTQGKKVLLLGFRAEIRSFGRFELRNQQLLE